MEREGWGEEVLPAKIVSISTSDGWCKELLLSGRTMVPARDSRVHYPEISDPLNPDSRTQRNERVLTEKSRKRLCFLANTQAFLSLYFLLSRFELEVSETDTRLAGFSGFWHFWLFQIVFRQTQFFFFSCFCLFRFPYFPDVRMNSVWLWQIRLFVWSSQFQRLSLWCLYPQHFHFNDNGTIFPKRQISHFVLFYVFETIL